MTKNTSSSETVKRTWHTPHLFIIRGQDAAQGKIDYLSEGPKLPGSEHIDLAGRPHGSGSAGPS